MKLNKTPRKKIGVVLVAIVAIGFLAVAYVYVESARHVNVAVQVVDAESGKPIDRANVIVTAWSMGTNGSQPVAFTAQTNSSGQVTIAGSAPFFVRYVGCEAAAPGKYAADHWLEDDFCELRLQPLTSKQVRDGKPLPNFTYDQFTGRWAHGAVNPSE